METPLVVPQFIGRLGNNLFQIAAAIAYAKKYGVKWGVPSVSKEVPNLHKFFPNMPIYEGNEFRRYNCADPSQFNYSPIPNHPNGVRLVGFWQSDKYFEAADDQIREMFKMQWTQLFKDYCSIHIRLGDYVKHSNSFPPITTKYISEAVSYIENKVGRKLKYILFSDDIDIAKKAVELDLPDIEFVCCYETDEYQALNVMHSCAHNIIANSSFSWWGAWLNPNPDKIVVSPSYLNWFGPGFTGSPPKDLIPYNWHQIKFR